MFRKTRFEKNDLVVVTHNDYLDLHYADLPDPGTVGVVVYSGHMSYHVEARPVKILDIEECSVMFPDGIKKIPADCLNKADV